MTEFNEGLTRREVMRGPTKVETSSLTTCPAPLISTVTNQPTKKSTNIKQTNKQSSKKQIGEFVTRGFFSNY